MHPKTAIATFCTTIMLALVATSAAAGASRSLGDCYNRVAISCNQSARPIPCSNAGMDACDAEHSASSSTRDINKLPGPKSKVKRNPTIVLQSAQ